MTSWVSFLQVALLLVAVAACPTGIDEDSTELPESVRLADEIDQRDMPRPGEIDLNKPTAPPILQAVKEVILKINKKIVEPFLESTYQGGPTPRQY